MSNFKLNLTQLYEGITKIQKKKDQVLKMYCDTKAKELQGHMKQYAPWTDRTGEARRRLSGTASKQSSIYRITLAHGVDYGIMLEQAHEKRYAIIEPTIRLEGPKVMKGFDKLLEKMVK